MTEVQARLIARVLVAMIDYSKVQMLSNSGPKKEEIVQALLALNSKDFT